MAASLAVLTVDIGSGSDFDMHAQKLFKYVFASALFLGGVVAAAPWTGSAPEPVAAPIWGPRCEGGCVYIKPYGCVCNSPRLTGAVESDEVVPVEEITLPSGESFSSR